MDKPTEEQIKEFWEWCGFYIKEHLQSDNGINRITILGLTMPDGQLIDTYPPIDLNNLFKYAVPKLQDDGYMVELYSYEQKGYKVAIYHITGQVDIPIAITTDEDPALALFWALWQVKPPKEKPPSSPVGYV